MKKIFQFLFFFLTVGFLLVSCYEYEESEDNRPTVYEPTIKSVGTTSVTFNEYPSYWNGYYTIFVSQFSDMRDAVECTSHEYTYREYNYKTHKYETRTGHEGLVTGLMPNTTYYAQSEISKECSNGGAKLKSPVIEFKTSAYEPTSYTISLTEVPVEENYGVFTVDINGITNYEMVDHSSTLRPSTQITGDATVYVTIPYISGASDPKFVNIYGGTDFYYASGTVNPASPSLKLTPKRFTANVNVNITFKAAKEDVDNVKLTEVAIVNVDGDKPICSNGNLNLVTGEFTAAESNGRYTNSTSTSISSGKTVSRKFTGVLPVKFDENTVKVVLYLSGDISESVVSVNLPAATWTEGSDVNVNLNAEYTAMGVELTVGSVNVTPWADGSTGNIDITK